MIDIEVPQGTPVGDPVEVDAIREVFAGLRKGPLLIGSVKPNLGRWPATASCERHFNLAQVTASLLAP